MAHMARAKLKDLELLSKMWGGKYLSLFVRSLQKSGVISWDSRG